MPTPYPSPNPSSTPGAWARLVAYVHGVVVDLARPGFSTRARKFLVAVTGALSQVLAVGILPSPWDHRAQVVLAVLTALAVYLTPNGGGGGSPADPGNSTPTDGVSGAV